MDSSGAASKNNKKNKRVSSDDDELEVEEDDKPKRTCLSSTTKGFESGVEHSLSQFWPQIQPLIEKIVVERLFVEWPKIQHSFRQQVREEINSIIQSQIHSLSPSLSKKDEIVEKKDLTTTSGSLKFKLCFVNSIDSIIFTNNEIKATNGEILTLVICDVTNSNSIVSTGPLSCAQIQFFILDGDLYSDGRPRDETYWTPSEFNESILDPRTGKPPLIIGNDLKLFLENGVAYIKNLVITDGSFRVRSGKFCLGAKIIDEKLLAEHPKIGEAVSEPFKVMDQRGEGTKKHHPPSIEDYVWRLEGIAKGGTYHNNLSSQGINNVGDFLKAYRERGPITLKTLLGKRVSEKTWTKMITNAEECVDVLTYDQTYETNFVENEVMGGEALKENVEVCEEEQEKGTTNPPLMINFEDLPSPSLFLPEEMDYKPTTHHTKYFQRVGPF